MATQMVKAAWRYLRASGVPAALVAGGLLGVDQTFPDGWVFSGDLTGDPYRSVEGTGKCAVVLYTYDAWSAAGAMHTLRYPRLQIAVYADDTRDQLGNPVEHDAELRCEAVHWAIHPLFHDAANRVHAFDDLRVISSVQGSALSVMAIPNGDGAVRGVAAYDITLG